MTVFPAQAPAVGVRKTQVPFEKDGTMNTDAEGQQVNLPCHRRNLGVSQPSSPYRSQNLLEVPRKQRRGTCVNSLLFISCTAVYSPSQSPNPIMYFCNILSHVGFLK